MCAAPVLRSRRSILRLVLACLLALPGLLAARPASAQTGSLTGIVSDTQGNRVFNALVEAIEGPSAGRETRTAADGSYLLLNLEAGDYVIRARRAGYASVTQEITITAGATSRLDFTLRANNPELGVLQGRVRRRDNDRPIAGARVRIASVAAEQEQVTDGDGFYQFADLPRGSYRIEVSRVGFVTQRRSGVTVREGRTTRQNFRLSLRGADLGELQGRVTDEEGRRIGGATVTLLDGVGAVASDVTSSTGFYRIAQIVPDTYAVEVEAAGFETQRIEDVVVGRAARVTLDITLRRAVERNGVIEGNVRDAEGNAIAGARVEITGGPEQGDFDVTDASGFYRLRGLPPGDYELTASATGFDDATRTVALSQNETERVDFTLTRAGGDENGTITGRVTEAGGGPLSGVTVEITDGPVSGFSATTDEDGEYALTELPPGFYDLRFSRSGFETVSVADVEVPAGATVVVDVEMNPEEQGGRISGRVIEPDRDPISGVLVEAFLRGNLEGSTTTDGSGDYAIGGLPAGTYDVRYSKSGYRTATLFNVVVTEGGTTVLNVTLSPEAQAGGTIRGFVRDTAGRSVQNATVELDGPSGPRAARTNAEGRFTFTDLPAGRGYRVRVSADGMESAEQSNITLREGETVNLIFTLRISGGQGGITGTVRNAFGLPIEGATVKIIRGPSSVLGESRTTSSTGRYSFLGLPPGSYTLEASARGYRSQQRDMTVVAGSTVARDFYLPRQ